MVTIPNDVYTGAKITGFNLGGWIKEEVSERIYNLALNIDLPLTNRIREVRIGNAKNEWLEDDLAAPALDNAVVDGSDIDQQDAKEGIRRQNQGQISVKEVLVSQRGMRSNTWGGDHLAYQVRNRMRELARDIEATCFSNQGSVADDGATVAGLSAGLGAIIETNRTVGATGSGGGFNTTTGLYDARTPGTARALTETEIRDAMQAIYEQGGDSMFLFCTPTVARIISIYAFSDASRFAVMETKLAQSLRGGAAMLGSATTIVSDHGQVCQIIPNRIQQPTSANVSDVFLIDTNVVEMGVLEGTRIEPLAKTGLSEKRLIKRDWSLRVLNQRGCALIGDIDETAPMTT